MTGWQRQDQSQFSMTILHDFKAIILFLGSTLAWKIPWAEEPGGLQSMGSLESGTNGRLFFHFSFSCIGEGNGNPLQYSCLENPMDRGAWRATVHGVSNMTEAT